jgi:hypothetical protein
MTRTIQYSRVLPKDCTASSILAALIVNVHHPAHAAQAEGANRQFGTDKYGLVFTSSCDSILPLSFARDRYG